MPAGLEQGGSNGNSTNGGRASTGGVRATTGVTSSGGRGRSGGVLPAGATAAPSGRRNVTPTLRAQTRGRR